MRPALPRLRAGALLAGTVLVAAVAASAQPATGRALLALCQSAKPADARACLAFLQDTSARIEHAIADGREEGWFCPPAEAQPALFRDAYVDWAAESPDQLDAPAADVVRAAWQDVFPCDE